MIPFYPPTTWSELIAFAWLIVRWYPEVESVSAKNVSRRSNNGPR